MAFSILGSMGLIWFYLYASPVPDSGNVYKPNLERNAPGELAPSSQATNQANVMPNREDKLLSEEDQAAFSAAMQEQLSELAQDYRQQTQYPPGSQPILDAGQLEQLKPNRAYPVDIVFPREDHEIPHLLTLQVDRHVYFNGEAIPIVVAVTGQDPAASHSANLVVTAVSGERLFNTTMQEDRPDGSQYSTLIDTQALDTANWPNELQLHAYVQTGAQRLNGVIPIKLHSPSALMVGVEDVRIEREYLVIPAKFDHLEEGYYFLSANLYDQESGLPLVHLESEGTLNQHQRTINLKAHIAALKISAKEGPYLLADIGIVRMAKDHENIDFPGLAEPAEIAVEGFPFDHYNDIPYKDPLAEERAEFLSQLGQ